MLLKFGAKKLLFGFFMHILRCAVTNQRRVSHDRSGTANDAYAVARLLALDVQIRQQYGCAISLMPTNHMVLMIILTKHHVLY